MLRNDSAMQGAEAHKPPAPSLMFFWQFFPATPRDIFTQAVEEKRQEV